MIIDFQVTHFLKFSRDTLVEHGFSESERGMPMQLPLLVIQQQNSNKKKKKHEFCTQIGLRSNSGPISFYTCDLEQVVIAQHPPQSGVYKGNIFGNNIKQ